jgi:hypothetical protein
MAVEVTGPSQAALPPSDDRYPLSPRVQILKAILAKIPAGTDAGAIAAAEAIRTAASDDGQKAPLGALGVKSESGPPMTLGKRRREPSRGGRPCPAKKV